ncbi:MAG: bifunctional [glutamine synthetase] adenylyltransferase/[glutamine synthetase]-adenylyl-L-tyrosine phosphorylase [Xanthobacteraceae bacterium]|nr:bifunctional [glutamine synthetase] adenylyltransferase/[glutamine synthetase]-adenylyl-L-tyrosine phosphorylase [Xanthobacteraceae bacterium]
MSCSPWARWGAFELNYSSDIDLIVLFDAEAAPLAPDVEPAALYIRLTRALVRLLQERTAEGYVFRVDLRLRPDPASTQIAVSLAAALSYYESIGQNWERAALIKARPCGGDLALGQAFLKEVAPFVWRKYLDYAAVGDIRDMKRQIHAYKGHDEIAIEGHNIKLGRGGIREIEFFAQTQQLIAGGRNPFLRQRETLEVLVKLAEGGWIDPAAAQDLGEAYRFLRSVEHRLQMIADEQTHSLPSDPDALARFARFLGFDGRDPFAAALVERLRKVERHYAQLFEGMPSLMGVHRPLVFPPDQNDRDTVDQLAELGFKQPVEASATVRRWLSGAYRSLKGEYARAHLAELVALFVDHLARADNPDAALLAFDRFLGGLHGGARFYSLLRQNPDFVALLGLILGTAPRLADIVAREPDVMDALLDPAFFGPLPDEAKLTRALLVTLDQSHSFEDFLDRARKFGHEQMFLVGVRVISGTVSGEQAGEAYARLADVLIRALEESVGIKFSSVHGRLEDQQCAILAMGRLGGREMTAGSDLDLILVYDFDAEHPESDGERSLYGGQYFARFTQRLISALTTQTNYGALYQVDMRLRPSGRSGPVATQIDGFRSYQENEAWTWEHLALTRARVVYASPGFAPKVEAVIREVLCRPRDAGTVAADVVEMRQAIAQEHGDRERWNLKYVAGGLIDLEFIAQYLQLVHAATAPEILDPSTARVLDKAWQLGLISPADAEVLRPAARLYNNLLQILRLCIAGPFDPKSVGAGLLGLLARAGDMPDFSTLDAHLRETQTRVRASFNRILGGG